jgi:hypothetical protein
MNPGCPRREERFNPQSRAGPRGLKRFFIIRRENMDKANEAIRLLKEAEKELSDAGWLLTYTVNIRAMDFDDHRYLEMAHKTPHSEKTCVANSEA